MKIVKKPKEIKKYQEEKLIIYRNYFPIWFPKMVYSPNPYKINYDMFDLYILPKKEMNQLYYNVKSTDLEIRAIQDRNEYQPLILKYLIFKNKVKKESEITLPYEIWTMILEYFLELSILDYQNIFKNKRKPIKISDIIKIFRNNYYLFPYLQYLP